MRRPIWIAGIVGVIAVAATLAVLIGQMTESFAYECEVCVEFNGGYECREARGATRDEAIGTARDLACYPLVGSRADSAACSRRQPARVQCEP